MCSSDLGTVVGFYSDLKRLIETPPDHEDATRALRAFKQLEKRNLHLKFRMAMEHLLGGPLTRGGLSPFPMEGSESGHKVLPLGVFHPGTNRIIRTNTEGRATVAKVTDGDYTLYLKFFPELSGIGEYFLNCVSFDRSVRSTLEKGLTDDDKRRKQRI